jgi:DNA-binding NarL/FixJ family response regulator
MQIAILGYRRNLREEVERLILTCMVPSSDIILCKYGMDEPSHNPAPPDVGAAFVIVDDAQALISLRTVARWGENLPVVIVSNDPQYALEGIRLQVRHYLLFPLTEKDMREALPRIGLEAKPVENRLGI